MGKEYNFIFKYGGLLGIQSGLVAIIHKKIQYSEKHILFSKSGFWTDLSIVDKIAKKGFQIIHTGDIQIIHTHLTCPYGYLHKKKMYELLHSQLEEIKNHINNNEIPTLLCGDMNLEPNHILLRNFLWENRLTDNSNEISKTYKGNFYRPKWFFNSSTQSEKLDYIFSKNIGGNRKICVHLKEGHSFISNHSGLIADIQN